MEAVEAVGAGEAGEEVEAVEAGEGHRVPRSSEDSSSCSAPSSWLTGSEFCLTPTSERSGGVIHVTCTCTCIQHVTVGTKVELNHVSSNVHTCRADPL